MQFTTAVATVCSQQIMMTNEMKTNEMKANDTMQKTENTMEAASECVPPAPIRTPKHAAKRVVKSHARARRRIAW